MKYSATLESIRQHRAPDWYHDCKLGIFVHWGLFSVPGWAASREEPTRIVLERGFDAYFRENPYAEWYLNTLKFEDGPTRAYHNRTFGKHFAYEDFQPIFEAESRKWNPADWSNLFRRAGAGYVVLTAKHADGYAMWPSTVGTLARPGYFSKRDLVGELAAAVRAENIRMGIYYSGGMDWSLNPERIDAFHKVYSTIVQAPEHVAYANAHWRELIDRYRPSVMWGDIMYPRAANLAELFAYYYNSVPDGVINDRFGTDFNTPIRPGLNPPGIHYDFVTPEYASFDEIQEEKWETCRGIGASFGYNRDDDETSYLSAAAVIRMFVDIVSKNGNLLLDVGPRADGSIHQLQQDCLLGLGAWLGVNGDAIYGTRPWVRAATTTSDGIAVRFTQKRDALYAILLDRPKTPEVRISNLAAVRGSPVHLLDVNEDLKWSQNGDDLTVVMPSNLPEQAAYAIRLTPTITRQIPTTS